MSRWLKIAFQAEIQHRALRVALLIGTLLMLINHGDMLMAATIEGERVLKILLTYLVPWLVSTYSSVESGRDRLA